MEKIRAEIANVVTGCQILFSLGIFVLSPFSTFFAVLYLLCGVSDVRDGFLARKLYTESKAGERLDSVADLFFTAAYAVTILPILHLTLLAPDICRIKSKIVKASF